MLLFADASDATTFAVAMALIASVASFGTAYLAYLSGRDKLKFDGEHIQMKADIKACEEDRDELRGRVGELEDRLDRRGFGTTNKNKDE